jgi:hypothetical protein
MGEGAEHTRQRFGAPASSCIAQQEIAMIPPAWAERRAWHGMTPPQGSGSLASRCVPYLPASRLLFGKCH